MLAGVGDDDIRREVLSTEDILSRSSYDIIFLIESKEVGHHVTKNLRFVCITSLLFSTSEKGCSNAGISPFVLLDRAVTRYFKLSTKRCSKHKTFQILHALLVQSIKEC